MKKRMIVCAISAATVAMCARPGSAQSQPEHSSETLQALSGSFARIVDQVAPSVVQVFVSGYGVGQGQFDIMTKQQGTASGTVIDPDGYIVTNADGATSLPSIYAGGDIVTGSATVILAMGAGKSSALAIDARLRS